MKGFHFLYEKRAKHIDLSSLVDAKRPASLISTAFLILRFVLRSLLHGRRRAAHRMHVQVALICSTSNTKSIHTREKAMYIRELVWPPAPGLTFPPSPRRSTEHPSISPWSIRPTTLLHPFFPFMLLTPTTPAFSSEFHRSSPIIRTCHLASRSPWKPPKEPLNISLVGFFSPSGSFHLYLRLSLLGSLGTRAIKLFRARQTPSLSLSQRSSIEINFCDRDDNRCCPRLALSPLIFAACHPLRVTFRLFTRDRAERGYRLLSDVFIFAFSPAFIGALGIFVASHLSFDNSSSVDSRHIYTGIQCVYVYDHGVSIEISFLFNPAFLYRLLLMTKDLSCSQFLHLNFVNFSCSYNYFRFYSISSISYEICVSFFELL